jgi:hypothetical protein
MLLLFALLAVLQQAPQTGTVEGTFVRLGTDFPIAGVEIRAVIASSEPLETVTDGAGRFVLRDVPPGRVSIEAYADGYVFPVGLPANAMVRDAVEAGYRSAEGVVLPNPVLRFSFDVAAGESIKLPAAPATPASAIRGRVVDSEGRGIPDVTVGFVTALADRAGRRLIMEVGTARTDSSGEYRRDMLGPGDYYVKATVDRPGAGAATLTVYHPAAPYTTTAAPIVLTEGAEATADIAITAALVANRFKISGRVLPVPGQSNDAPVGILLKTQGLPSTVVADIASDAKTGHFELNSVPEGSYDVFASAKIADREYLGKVQVEIRDRNVEDVDVALQPSVEVRGRLIINAESGLQLYRPGAGAVRVSLSRKDRLFGDILKPEIDDAGVAFSFRDVPPGDYDISVRLLSDHGPVRPDFYVGDIRAGGRSVVETGFEAGVDATDDLEILIGTNGGAVNGTVLNSNSKRPATVILIPELALRGNAALFGAVVTNADGQFEFRGLAPGTYKIFAVPPGTPLSRRNEFISQYESGAVTVVVKKGTPISGIQLLLGSPGK